MKKYDEYGIEQESINITPYVIIGLISFFVLTGLVVLIMNLGNIKNFIFKDNESNKTSETSKDKEEIKIVNGLVEPVVASGEILGNKEISIELINVKASSKGYTLTIEIRTATNSHNYNYTVKCSRILIDGYEIEGSFETTVEPNTTSTVEVLLKKTDLDELEINNFKKLRFFINASTPKRNYPVDRTAEMENRYAVNNNKKNLTIIDETENLSISFYKKIEDNDYTYLYFQFANTEMNNYKIYLSRLFINSNVYDVEFTTESKNYGKTIKYIRIPKNDIENIRKIKVAFFAEKIGKEGEFELRITPEREIEL